MSSTGFNHKINKTPSGKKTYVSTPNTFEQKFGYHRAVKKGPFICVSGTTALKFKNEYDEDLATYKSSATGDWSTVHYPNDTLEQASLSMQRAIDAIEALGGKTEDVVRVRMFVARHEDTSKVGEAFNRHFCRDVDISEIGAAATMIVVQNGFVDPDMLVEIEMDAVIT